MSDQLENSQRFRMLNIIDLFYGERVYQYWLIFFPAQEILSWPEELKKIRGLSEVTTVDNDGTEFISKKFEAWAYENGVKLDYVRPRKAKDNAFIESFSGKFRDECLNANIFNPFEGARPKCESWMRDYNNLRPHSSLNDLSANRVR